MNQENPISFVVCRTLILIICCLNASLAQVLSSIDFKFREEQFQGSYVGNIGITSRLAASLTENEFSRLKFNLPDSKYFKIDEKTGSLTSAVKIDREEVCDGQLVCKLTNEIIVYTRIGAGSYDILKVITVNVEILDINDNTPEFPSGAVSLTIPESNDLDHVLRTRSAVDKDTGDNSVKQYRFQDFTDTFRLTVHRNPDGSSFLGIMVKEKLDREVRDFYQVTIIATDGGFPQRSGSVVINITVTDINDNSPEFTQASYNETMLENMALKVAIMKLKATDLDAGKNGEISYQFSPRVTNKIRQKFYIDEHTGELYAQSNIDYEEDKLFQFIVEAVDHGTPQQISRTNVNLHVIDMNDNTPQIVINLPPTGTEVAENEPVGKFVAHISILDLDSGSNGAVSCVMDDENFSLDKFSEYVSNRYKVVLARPLDYEQNTYHRVTITCTDGGIPALSNSTTFVVNVLDMNDNRPTFTESVYSENVLENQEGDQEILEVTAHDWDSGDFGKVTYSIEDKYNGLFSIHYLTGVLSLLHTLDREYNSRYEFYVIARDNGPEKMSSSVLVVIIVDDENDEPPRFPKPVYFGDILENQPAGTSVGVTSAVDNDSPANAKMLYSILQQGQDYINFSISPTTGVIISQTVFDREEKQQYHLMVKVVDPSKPSFFSICNFTVRVLDDNDHSPVIQTSSDDNSTLFIQSSALVGSIITKISAYDGDEISSQHSDLTFLIEKGDPDQLFDLNRYTGSLTLARVITARDFKTYNLVIVVQDSGDPPRFDTKLLSIKVNGTMPSVSESGLSENIIIAVVIVSVTVVLALVILVTILLIRRFDRQRRRNRANQKNSEEKMYQLNKQELFTDLPNDHSDGSNGLSRKGKKESKLLSSSTAMLDHETDLAAQADRQKNMKSPPRDEECRLIEILNNTNNNDAINESSEDTDPSDSGRGGSEDETYHRGSGLDPERPGPGRKPYPQSSHRGARSATDSSDKQPYHQQKYHPPKSALQTSAATTKGRPLQQSKTSKRSPHNSLTSDIDSDISGSRTSQIRSDTSMKPGNQTQPSGNSDSSGRLLKQTLQFPSRDQQPSRIRPENSSNRLVALKDNNSTHVQSFQGQAKNSRQTAPPVTSNNKQTLVYPNKSYAPPSRSYKYTDRTYPLSESLSSPSSLPEDDERTTTSGSYTVNPEELRPELDALILHDTVV